MPDTTTTTDEARRESRLRSRVTRAGYVLRKDRARTWNLDHHGGYRIIDPSTNFVMAGDRYDLDLDDVEYWLDEPEDDDDGRGSGR